MTPSTLNSKAGRLDGLPQQLQQVVEGTAHLVRLEDVLAGLEREVPVLRLHLALEDRTELEL